MKEPLKMMVMVVMVVGALADIGLAQNGKKVLIVNFPGNDLKTAQTAKAVEVLEKAGFVNGKNMALTIAAPQTLEEGVAAVNKINPDVVLDFNARYRLPLALKGADVPIVMISEAEKYVAKDGTPTGNITGTTTTLNDMVYNSYKFLQMVAPFPAGKQAVFIKNGKADFITDAMVTDALQRMDIPLKTVVDGTVYEDWQDAILRYSDDPEVEWMLMGIWPLQRRNGAPTNHLDTATWQRTHLKKPTITYWDIAVQWAMLCGFAVDTIEIAAQAAEMAARILNGEEIETVKAVAPNEVRISLNRKTAEFLGITISLDVLRLVDVIYDDYEGKQVIRK